MPVNFKQGDLFQEQTDALVNTVNCVGVMGKGVALEFKRRWPKNYAEYRRLCKARNLRPGNLFIFERGDLLDACGPRFLINFPTKDHWRSKSKLEYVSSGLKALRQELEAGRIRSIAMPPLGCGNGGLEWSIVKEMIFDELNDLDSEVIVLEPFHERDEPEHLKGQSIELTFRRAALLKTLGDLEPLFGGGFDRLSLQKITYFLQELGIDFRLSFARDRFGPYSESLKKAFASLESQGAMAGFTDDEQISHVTKSGFAAADDFLINDGKDAIVTGTIQRLSNLIEGFESPYGLELLSTVHHLAKHESVSSLSEIVSKFHQWSDRKKEKFSDKAIKNAYNRLIVDEMIVG